jgi:hypothetical protein
MLRRVENACDAVYLETLVMEVYRNQCPCSNGFKLTTPFKMTVALLIKTIETYILPKGTTAYT